ncbi:hypothetical protein ABT186_01265 [Streptomyces sp. NPDC001634]|uniref:hypothetical protein n=1 Tax=Streptomyces sp. NPDC001634 TaxID=3154390 RepID=UPI00331F2113
MIHRSVTAHGCLDATARSSSSPGPRARLLRGSDRELQRAFYGAQFASKGERNRLKVRVHAAMSAQALMEGPQVSPVRRAATSRRLRGR